jgi:hypothetical protein
MVCARWLGAAAAAATVAVTAAEDVVADGGGGEWRGPCFVEIGCGERRSVLAQTMPVPPLWKWAASQVAHTRSSEVVQAESPFTVPTPMPLPAPQSVEQATRAMVGNKRAGVQYSHARERRS